MSSQGAVVPAVAKPIGLQDVHQFSTQGLLLRYATDGLAALAAGVGVAPFVTIVDRSIIKNASGAQPLWDALKSGVKDLFLRPRVFFAAKDWRIVAGVYATTYLAANWIETSCRAYQKDYVMAKFVGTSAANIIMGVRKDMIFTKMFGMIKPTKLPIPSYFMFLTRDCLTIGAAFTIPPMLATYLSTVELSYGLPGTKPVSALDAQVHAAAADKAAEAKTAGEKYKLSYKAAEAFAQFVCPISIQLLSTPFHLTALDLYNNKHHTAAQRFRLVAKNYPGSALARMARIGPAFGIGGIGNIQMRSLLGEAAFPYSLDKKQ